MTHCYNDLVKGQGRLLFLFYEICHTVYRVGGKEILFKCYQSICRDCGKQSSAGLEITSNNYFKLFTVTCTYFP